MIIIKILLVGQTTFDKKQLPHDLNYEFTKRGHTVLYFNYRKYLLHKLPFTRKLVSDRLVKLAYHEKPDLVFVIKGESLIKGTIAKIKKTGAITANWNPDEPFGEIMSFNIVPGLKEYDYYFSFSATYLDRLKKIREKNTYHIAFAANDHTYRQIVPPHEREYKYDVSLIGTAYKERIDIMSKLTKYHICVAGPKWDESILKHQCISKYLSIEDMNRVFNQSKVNLNVFIAQTYATIPNPRTFEIPLTNSFQIATYFKEIEDYFKADKEIVFYKDNNELFDKIKYYLKHNEQREEIMSNGYKKVLENHLLKHRIDKMFSIMNLN